MRPGYLYAGAGALALIALAWLLNKGNAAELGQAAGAAVIGVVGGVVTGAASEVVTVANDPGLNPLQPFGAWLGGTIFDVLHPAQ